MHVTIIQRLVSLALFLLVTPQLPASQLLPVLPDGNVPDAGNALGPADGLIANQDTAQVDLERIKKVLTGEIREMLEETGIPSISIALLKDDSIVWAEAFGYANVKLKVPATAETIYGTGSCLKPITAMAVMQLADKGKLKLDDPINQYLGEHAVADLSAKGKPVTVRHLLAHYSGLTVKHEIVPLWERNLPRSLEQLAAELKAEREPGTRYEYSNSGYALAGLLIQKVSGQSYEQYLVDNILRPVGVNLSGPIHPTPEMIEQLALPYRLENNIPVPVKRVRFDVYPAGDAYLSVPAMSKVLLTHLNGGKHNGVSLLSEASILEMCKRQFGGKDGLDFGIREVDGENLIMHGGGVPGYSTKFILGVESRIGVYIASNAIRVQLPVRILAQRAIDLLRGKEIGNGLVREIVGIGTVLAEDEETRLLRIADVYPKSSAGRAGLSSGLIIQSINGKSIKGKSIKECLGMMGGPAGTRVRLEIINPEKNEMKTVELTKGEFLIPG